MSDYNKSGWKGAMRSYACALGAAALITACGGGGNNNGGGTTTPPPPPPPPPASVYSMTPLVSDGSTAGAPTTDTKLINPWGIVFTPSTATAQGSPVWIANNATQTSTLYDGTGKTIPLVVSLPAGTNGDADATGIVANPSAGDFAVTNGTLTGVARFIFDGEGGTIIGWAPSVDQTHALIAYDDGAGGAVYKGLAVATDTTGANFLFATDFHNNKIDTFDKTFTKVTTTGGFTDATLPAGYAPFGIQAVTSGGTTILYVTYAQRQTTSDDNVNGAGLGLVNTFDLHGTLLKHLVPVGGALNAPWGVTLAPTGFGDLSGKILIGNFGDGVINAYAADTGTFATSIKNSGGSNIATPGLWGIAFGNGSRNQPATTLYFAAGVANEADGLYGRIDLGATPPDAVAPAVAITAPAAGATVSGAAVAITVTATDNVGVASVDFLAGTTVLGTSTTSPFTFTWNTTTAAAGAVNLTAVAKDAAGNATTSAQVSVTVDNTAAPPPATTLTQLQANIFGPKCSSCHTGVGAALPGVMNLSSAAASFTSLVNVTSINGAGLKRVLPNQPNDSFLVHKLEGTDLNGTSRMPLNGPFLDQATIDTVRSWISAGAQNN